MLTYEKLLDFLREEADECLRMSTESRTGGWSTHQCKPLEDKAIRLYKMAITIVQQGGLE